ncbi:sulfotransferase family protein [Streptomyces sp. NPDC001393]
MTGPVLLVGCQRSGTTALSYALSSAFAAAGGHFTVNGKLPYLLDRWLTPVDLEARHFRADEVLYALDRKPPQGTGVEVWRAQAEAALRRAARDVAEGAVRDADELAHRITSESYAGFPYWGDKYNEYLLHLPRLGRMLPDARFLVLVRHPDEVADSMLRWTGDRPWCPVSRAAAHAKWTAWNAAWLEFSASLPTDRFLVAEYRDVCRGEATARMEAFLGLELTPFLAELAPRTNEVTGGALPAETERVWAALTDQARPVLSVGR